jgi:diaminopimelate decarboxylase
MGMDDNRPEACPELTPKEFKENYGEFIGVGDNGNLWVEDCDVAELAERFGTPLFIISESQFRYTYRVFRDAFKEHYPGESEILFANKSNNGLAYRHIMNQEGAGGDCFGVNELYLALLAGTDASTLVLNGSNKQEEELEMAVANGLCINIDAMDELDRIDAICTRQGRHADVGIRLKLDLDPLAEREGVAMHGPGTMKEQSDSTKWGMTREQTVEIVKRALKMPHVHLKETHFHLSRMSNVAMDFAIMAREMITWSGYIRDNTGWTPPCIDIGGGWTFGKWYGTGRLCPVVQPGNSGRGKKA